MAEPKDAAFDPYHKWLGIPKQHRPPTFYHLLGLTLGESDPEVIEEAAIRQSTHLRTYQVGQHADLCTKLLNEVGRARQVLLNPQKRAEYDNRLAGQSGTRLAAAAPLVAPLAAPVTSVMPRPVEEANPFEMGGGDEEPEPTNHHDRKGNKPHRKKNEKAKKGSSKSPMMFVVGGGVAAVAAVVGVVVWLSSSKPAPVPVAPTKHERVEVPSTPKDPKPADPVKPADSVKPVEPFKPPFVAPKPPFVPPQSASGIPEFTHKPGDPYLLKMLGRGKFSPTADTVGGLRNGAVAIGAINNLKIHDYVANKTFNISSKEGASDYPQVIVPVGDDDTAILMRPDQRSVRRVRYKNDALTDVTKYKSSIEPVSIAAATRGSKFWVGGKDGLVLSMDADAVDPLLQMTGPQGDVALIATPANGDFAAWTVGKKLVVAWDQSKLSSGDMPSDFHPTLAVSPDGQHVVASNSSGLHVAPIGPSGFSKDKLAWDCRIANDAFRVLAFSPDGKYLLSARDQYLFLWEWPGLKLVGRAAVSFSPPNAPPPSPIKAIAFAPDAPLAYVGDTNGYVAVAAFGEAAMVARLPVPKKSKTDVDPPVAKPKEPPPTIVKIDVPAADKLADATKKIRESFAKEFAAAKKSATDRVAFVEKLQQLAKETLDDPVGRYALLTEAKDLACLNGKWSTVAEILDTFAAEYLVDRAAQRLEALRPFLKNSTGKEAAEEACNAALESVAECVTAERLELAKDYLKFGETAALKAKSKTHEAFVNRQEKDLRAIEQDFEKMQKAKALLAGGDNPAAHLDVGRYLALRKGDWDAGLKHLAKAGTDELAEVARLDVANPQESRAQQEVGDAWWKLAEKEKEKDKKSPLCVALQSRAGFWYRQAVSKATGLAQTVMNDRLKLISEAPGARPPGDAAAEAGRINKAHNGLAVTALQVSHEGRYLHSSGLDGFVRKWDVSNGRVVRNENFNSPIFAFELSPDSRYYAAYDRKRVCILPLFSRSSSSSPPSSSSTTRPKSTTTPNSDYDPRVVQFFSSTGPCWLNNQFSTPVLLYVNEGRFYRRSAESTGTSNGDPIGDDPPRFGRTASNQVLMSGSDVYVIDRNGSPPRAAKLNLPQATCAAALPDGSGLVVGFADKTIRKYDGTSAKLTSTYAGLGAPPNCIAVSESGRFLVAGGNDRVILVWDLESEKIVARFTQHTGAVTAIAIMPAERQVVSASSEAIRFWNLPNANREKAGAPGSPVAAADSRTFWLYRSSGKDCWFKKMAGKQWVESTDSGVELPFEEFERTDSYVDLFDRSRDIYIRLTSDRFDLRRGQQGPWSFRHAGRWSDPAAFVPGIAKAPGADVGGQGAPTAVAKLDATGSYRDEDTIRPGSAAHRVGGRERMGKVYSVDMIANVRYRIALNSPSMDSFLFVFDQGDTVLASDDDGGGGRNSLLVYRPSYTGRFRILATSLNGTSTGDFSLTINRVQGP